MTKLAELMEKFSITKLVLPNGVVIERPPLLPESNKAILDSPENDSFELTSPEDLEFSLHNLGNEI